MPRSLSEPVQPRAAFADRRRLGFNPVIDGTLFPGGPFAPKAPLTSLDVPLMIGSNKDEMTLFLGHMPWVADATFESLPESLTPYLGVKAAEVVATYRKAQPRLRPDEIAIAIVSDLGVRAPSLLIAERKLVQEKLIKFATRIPAFMYLTDFRENTLQDVITKLEPDLFLTVTGLTVQDFHLLVRLKVFNTEQMNQAVFAFRRYEDASLRYTGIESHDGLSHYGLYDTVVARE